MIILKIDHDQIYDRFNSSLLLIIKFNFKCRAQRFFAIYDTKMWSITRNAKFDEINFCPSPKQTKRKKISWPLLTHSMAQEVYIICFEIFVSPNKQEPHFYLYVYMYLARYTPNTISELLSFEPCGMRAYMSGVYLCGSESVYIKYTFNNKRLFFCVRIYVIKLFNSVVWSQINKHRKKLKNKQKQKLFNRTSYVQTISEYTVYVSIQNT